MNRWSRSAGMDCRLTREGVPKRLVLGEIALATPPIPAGVRIWQLGGDGAAPGALCFGTPGRGVPLAKSGGEAIGKPMLTLMFIPSCPCPCELDLGIGAAQRMPARPCISGVWPTLFERRSGAAGGCMLARLESRHFGELPALSDFGVLEREEWIWEELWRRTRVAPGVPYRRRVRRPVWRLPCRNRLGRSGFLNTVLPLGCAPDIRRISEVSHDIIPLLSGRAEWLVVELADLGAVSTIFWSGMLWKGMGDWPGEGIMPERDWGNGVLPASIPVSGGTLEQVGLCCCSFTGVPMLHGVPYSGVACCAVIARTAGLCSQNCLSLSHSF